MRPFFRARHFPPTGTGKRANESKTKIVLPKSVFLDQQSEKGTFKLKTRVLDALGLQEGPFSDDSGPHLGSLAIAFSPSERGKR